MKKSKLLMVTVILVAAFSLLTVSLAFAGDGMSEPAEVGAVSVVPGGQGPCEGGVPGVVGIWHDDGTFENGYSGNPSLVSTFENVDLFNPAGAAYDYTHYCVALVSLAGTDLNFEIVFFDNDGAGGTPGTELAAVPASATGLPPGLPCAWYDFDLTGAAGLPTGADGDIYIGVRYNPMTYPSRFTCADQSAGTPLWTGYTNFNTGSGWQATNSVFTGYRAMSHRVEMTEAQEPAIELAKTVGLDPLTCAPTNDISVPSGGNGTDVYYCYEVTNTGDITLTVHDLSDSELGDIFTGLAYDLGPGDSVDTVAAGLTVSATITETTMNVATWTASVPGGPSATSTATATVTVLPPTAVSLSVFDGGSGVDMTIVSLGVLLVAALGFGLILRRKMAD